MVTSYNCSECNSSFSSPYNLKRHKERYHKNVYDYQDDSSNENVNDSVSKRYKKTYDDEDAVDMDETHSSLESDNESDSKSMCESNTSDDEVASDGEDEENDLHESDNDSNSERMSESNASDDEEEGNDISESDNDSDSKSICESDTSDDEEEKRTDDTFDGENENDACEYFVEDALLNYEDEYQELLQCYRENGLSKVDAAAKAFKALRPYYKKSLRKSIARYISDMIAIRHTPLFQSIFKKMKYFEEDGLDEEEAIKSAVSYRKYLIYNLLNSHIKNLLLIEEEKGSDIEYE